MPRDAQHSHEWIRIVDVDVHAAPETRDPFYTETRNPI